MGDMKWVIFTIIFLVIPHAAVAQEISLSAALDQVQEQNEDWQIVAERIEQSRTLRREALAALLPQATASGSTTYNGQEVQFGDSVVRRQIDWSAGASATVTLFDATAYPLLTQASRNLELTELSGEWQRQTILFEVESTYFLLAAAQRDAEIAAKTVELREAYVERATALEAAGIALPLDVARAKSQHLEAKQFLLEAIARVGNQADALAVLLAQEPDGELRAESQPESPPPPPESANVPKQRSDLAAQRVTIEASEALESSRWWAFAPRLDLRSDLRFGPPSFTAPDGVTWSITLAATWLLYDGGARYARIQAAQSQVREAELELRIAERRADAGLSEALRNWRAAFEAIDVAAEQAEVAQQAYDMVTARFDSGLVTSIEVTEASDELFRAESNLSAARLSADIAAARFRYLVPVD